MVLASYAVIESQNAAHAASLLRGDACHLIDLGRMSDDIYDV
jgi:hypothetical protein